MGWFYIDDGNVTQGPSRPPQMAGWSTFFPGTTHVPRVQGSQLPLDADWATLDEFYPDADQRFVGEHHQKIAAVLGSGWQSGVFGVFRVGQSAGDGAG